MLYSYIDTCFMPLLPILGQENKGLMLYDYEDTFLYYPDCSVNPCADDSEFEDLFIKITAGNNQLR